MIRLALVFFCCVLVAPALQAQDAERYTLRAPLDSARTQILVLGTQHLSPLGDGFDPALVGTLLDALARFGPDLIAVEQLPPPEIERLVTAAPELATAFAGGTVRIGREAQGGLGLTRAEAEAVSDSLLASVPLDDADRRSAAVHLLAAYDAPTAVLQWTLLPESARVAGGPVSPEIAAHLDKRAASPNEVYAVAVPLARQLGHDRVASVDDHVDDEIAAATGYYDEFGPALESSPAYADLAASGYFEEAQRQLPEAAATGDLLPLHLRLNSAEYLNADVAAQWHIFFRTAMPSGYDRRRAALWEARNLNMAARLRTASAFVPGGRVLLIVGAAHKPFLDRYLAQMMDVEVVHLSEYAEP